MTNYIKEQFCTLKDPNQKERDKNGLQLIRNKVTMLALTTFISTLLTSLSLSIYTCSNFKQPMILQSYNNPDSVRILIFLVTINFLYNQLTLPLYHVTILTQSKYLYLCLAYNNPDSF